MSNILIDKLNSIGVFKRPVHCIDVKNETIYMMNMAIHINVIEVIKFLVQKINC